MFLWSFSFGAMTISGNDILTRIFWSIGFFSGVMFFPVWLTFVSHLIPIKNRTALILLKLSAILTVIIALLCVAFGNVRFDETILGNQYNYHGCILFQILFGYVIIMSGVLVYFHVLWFLRSELKRNKRQVLTLIIISFILIPIALITEFVFPVFTETTVTSVGTIAILPAAMFVFYSMRKYKLFGLTVSNVSEDIFSSVNRAIYVLDNKNNIVIENNAAIEILGTGAIGECLPDRILVNDEVPDDSFFDNNFASATIKLKNRSGTTICDMTLTIDKDNFDEAIFKIVVLRDITARIAMEDKLRTALSEAIEANRVKNDFLTKMSHEIRTPMNAIVGMTELVLREKTSNVVREHATTIRQASSNLLYIIDELLDFSKIEAGNIQLRPESYSLSSLVDDVVNLIRIKVYDSDVEFIVNLDGNLPNQLFGDEGRIRQILINIIGNAIKHTEKGNISLSVNGEIGENDILNLILSVEDTGSGISEENLEHLFTEYFQVRKESEGVGLGLSITQGLVTAMDGRINVESEIGKGTKFTITLPQNIENHEKVADIQNNTKQKTGSSDMGKGDKKPAMFTAPEAKVLVVDDIKTNLKVVSGFLDPYKMTVDLCLSGKDAIEMVKTEHYDLIFMDYRMPEMDGIEATRQIRELDDDNEYYKNLPIIALTADAVAGRKEMFIENKFNDFMSKPIDGDKLFSILEEWLPKQMQVISGSSAHKKQVDMSVGENDLSAENDDSAEITLNATDGLAPIDGIDIGKGVKLSGGTVPYFYETLASFHSDVLERFDLIKDSIENGDLSHYTTFVHALKSASANIGAGEVSSQAHALENAGDNADWDFIHANNEKFFTALRLLLDNIKVALTSYDAKDECADDGSGVERSRQLQSELEALTAALDSYDIVATNQSVETLLRLAHTEDEKKSIRDISQHILLFEYDKALEIINGII